MLRLTKLQKSWTIAIYLPPYGRDWSSALRPILAGTKAGRPGSGEAIKDIASRKAILPDRYPRPPSLPAFSDIQIAAIQRGEPMDDDDDDNARAAAARKGSPFLNTAQTAHYLGISARTLEALRERGEGPPFRKHGRLVRYHIAEVEAWSFANKWNRALGRPRKPCDGTPQA